MSDMQWIKSTSVFVVSILLAIFSSSCGGKSAPSTPSTGDESVSSTAEGSGNTLQEVSFGGSDSDPFILISGSQPMSPNIFKLTDPSRIIVDLTDTSLGSLSGPIRVDRAGIQEITLDQFDDGASSLSRIVVSLDQLADYEVESDGNSLKLKIRGMGAAGDVPGAGLPGLVEAAPSEDAFAPEPLLNEPLVEGEPLPLVEAEETLGVEPVAEPFVQEEASSPATELTDVQYTSTESGTTVTLLGNGSFESLEDFVLSDPNRLVIDLKGVRNAYAGKDQIALSTSEVQNVRLGESDGNVRVVLDIPHSGTPAYTINRDANGITLNLARVEVANTPIESASTESSAFPLEVEEPLPPETDAVAAEEPAIEEPLEPMMDPAIEPMVDEPAMAVAPSPSFGPVEITGLGFTQLEAEGKSRLIIGLTEQVGDYRVKDDVPGRVIVEIPNSKFQRPILRRTFDTSEFQTAITNVVPEASGGSTRFVVNLEQQVPYQVLQEGNSLYVDVQVPSQILRKQTQTPVGDVAAPSLKAPDADAPIEQTEEDFGALGDEMVMESEAPKPSKTASPAGRNYRNVTETFMSDSTESGEPLSRMGQILAGDYSGKKFTGRKISLDFKDAEIRSIFRLLADISKLNMIISDEVTGRVTIRLDNVPWDQAFAIILQTKSLWFEKFGNIVRIAPAEKLRQERELAAAAAKAAESAKPLDVLFKPVSYASAGELVRQVRTVLSGRGTVDIDSRTNTLIIKDIRENLEKAKSLVDILDTQTPQVTIESRIVEASTNYTRSFGIIWGGQAQFSSATGNPTGVFFPQGATAQGTLGSSFSGLPIALNYPSPLGANSAVGLRFGSINNVVDLDLALGVLESQGYAKLISAPKATVLDNQTANIVSGTKIPFLTQTANAGSNVRFETAATSLTVTPSITNDGSVTMTISATRSEPNFSQVIEQNPVVDQRSASTTVLVKSGNTTVLGGIYSIRTGWTQTGLPGLSKIPVLGWLFKNYGKELRRSELLFFVTPRIVGDEREAVRDVRG